MDFPTEDERVQYAKMFFGDKWSRMTNEEKEIFRNPVRQVPVGVIFPATPWSTENPPTVRSENPAYKVSYPICNVILIFKPMRGEKKGWPKENWYFFQSRGIQDPNVMHAWLKKLLR